MDARTRQNQPSRPVRGRRLTADEKIAVERGKAEIKLRLMEEEERIRKEREAANTRARNILTNEQIEERLSRLGDTGESENVQLGALVALAQMRAKGGGISEIAAAAAKFAEAASEFKAHKQEQGATE